MEFGVQRLAASLASMERDWERSSFCVALSGGVDSSVLVHAMASLARITRCPLRAVHVDHGLQADSTLWARSCRALCRAAGVPLTVVSLERAVPSGASVEAVARDLRYAALAAELRPDEWLLTAHHGDDQLETVLIQLLRGAGISGLAAMPPRARLGQGWHARPLLGFDRAQIAAYAARHGIAAIQDPMNASLRFDRGWLRVRVLPALRERWPAAATTVSRSAGHAAEAARVLAEVAAEDAAGAIRDGCLSLAALAGLGPGRRVNLVRWWLRQAGLRPPPAARLASAMSAFLSARVDARPLLRWPDGEVRRYRGHLYALRPTAAPRDCGPVEAKGIVDLGPGLGRFGLVAGRSGGLPVGEHWVIRFRSGGECLRPAAGRPRRRLKDLCREAGILPWMRDCLPLVCVGDRLAAVGDLWLDADLLLPPGETGLQPVWEHRPRLR
jgi:tRNA(Ile)-lysidine synthase